MEVELPPDDVEEHVTPTPAPARRVLQVEGIQALSEFDLHVAHPQASWLFQTTLVRSNGISYR